MFNQKPLHFSWNWQLKSTPEQLWTYITDTNHLLKNLKQPTVQQTNISPDVEPGLIQLSYNGINRYEVWEEEPYEWEYPYRFGVVRHYQSGAYKDLKIQVDLRPNNAGTRIQFQLWAKPRLSILSYFTTLKIKTLFKNRLKKTVHTYDKLALQDKKPFQHSNQNQLVRGGKQRLTQIREELHNSEVNATILEKIISHIRSADDLDLQRIQPYDLADCWNMPRKDVLEVFFHATKAGLVNFNWDLRCPTCRSIQESATTLNKVHEPIFCSKCEQEFNVNFNKTIELSFTPNPLIRKINEAEYCIRGPQKKPHVLIQQYLEPGENRYLKTDLPEGTYILRTSDSEGTATICVVEDGKDTVHIALQNSGLNGEQVNLCSDPNLSIKNNSTKTQTITVEKRAWSNNRVSAAQATSTQLFRNLFGEEVLRKGEKISVDNLTLMFTDLFDSTGIYNEEGDDKAVGQVIDHFEILQHAIAQEDGAIVKTIGDSVMAVFCEPAQALRAYLKAQEFLAEDERFSKNLQLKAGIHHGSCVAVNLNSRIDYFGSTVNIASRFVDHATENEIIISQEAGEQASLDDLLKEFKKNSFVEDIKTRLKGFDNESFAIKSIKVDDSPLRLAI